MGVEGGGVKECIEGGVNTHTHTRSTGHGCITAAGVERSAGLPPPRLQRLHVNDPLEGRHERLQPLLQVVDVLLRARGEQRSG